MANQTKITAVNIIAFDRYCVWVFCFFFSPKRKLLSYAKRASVLADILTKAWNLLTRQVSFHWNNLSDFIPTPSHCTQFCVPSQKYKNIPTGSGPFDLCRDFAPFRDLGRLIATITKKKTKKHLFTLLVRAKHQCKAVLVTGTAIYGHPHPRYNI